MQKLIRLALVITVVLLTGNAMVVAGVEPTAQTPNPMVGTNESVLMQDDDGDDNESEANETVNDRFPEVQWDVNVTEDTDDDVQVDGNVSVTEGVEVDGRLNASGIVAVRSDAESNDEITADGDVYLPSDVDRDVVAGDNVTVTDDAEIDGNITAEGTVVLGENVEVDGDVTGTSVRIADSAEVDGEVTKASS